MARVIIKVVLLGKENGGKTSLLDRYLHGRFSEHVAYQSTIGAAFGRKKVEVNGKTITVDVWDTAGSERYASMSAVYYRGARAAIVCYDLTDSTSFNRVRYWVDELTRNEERCKIYLCGTKKDLVDEGDQPRKVDYHMTTDYGEDIGAPVYETSSKAGENIHELFLNVVEDFANDPRNLEITEKSTVDLKKSKIKTSSSCRCG